MQRIQQMQRVVLTGGPGAGKTTVLELLGRHGYETGGDAARSIIRERKLAGLPARPEPLTFAQQVLEREIDAYQCAESSPSFFERGVVDAVASLLAAGGLAENDVDPFLAGYNYQQVFLFPPWEEIYCVDAERDHTFDHAVRVYHATLAFYQRHGYDPLEVPRGSVADRAGFILDQVLNT